MTRAISVFLFLAASLTSQANAQVSFAIARLSHIQNVTYNYPVGPDQIRIDAIWTRTFRLKKTLYGTIPDRVIRDVHFSAWPVLGIDYYLLVDRSRGVSEIVYAIPASAGVCLPADIARAYHTDSLLADLEKKHPCALEGDPH